MQIEVHAPPTILRRSYSDFLTRSWCVGVGTPDRYSGGFSQDQTERIHSAAKNFGMRVQTTVQMGRIYVRFREEVRR